MWRDPPASEVTEMFPERHAMVVGTGASAWVGRAVGRGFADRRRASIGLLARTWAASPGGCASRISAPCTPRVSGGAAPRSQRCRNDVVQESLKV